MTPPSTMDTLVTLFFSGLLPVVWLALAALIYRYDVHDSGLGPSGAWSGKADRTVDRWRKLPGWLRGFIGHFWAGTASRYRAAANSVYLAAAGIVPLVVLVILYPALDWASAWTWMGATRLIGPHSRAVWEGLAMTKEGGHGQPTAADEYQSDLPVGREQRRHRTGDCRCPIADGLRRPRWRRVSNHQIRAIYPQVSVGSAVAPV